MFGYVYNALMKDAISYLFSWDVFAEKRLFAAVLLMINQILYKYSRILYFLVFFNKKNEK